MRRLPDVERRHLARQSNYTIATALGVDEGTVRQDLKHLRELWLERIKDDQEHLRARVVASLADVASRALAAAEFDEEAERAVLYGEDANGREVYVRRDEKGSAQFRGNKAAALGQARQAIMDQAKVLGLVVDKTALTDTAGNTMTMAALIAVARTVEIDG